MHFSHTLHHKGIFTLIPALPKRHSPLSDETSARRRNYRRVCLERRKTEVGVRLGAYALPQV